MTITVTKERGSMEGAYRGPGRALKGSGRALAWKTQEGPPKEGAGRVNLATIA